MFSTEMLSLRVTPRVHMPPRALAVVCFLIASVVLACVVKAQDSAWTLSNVHVIDVERGRVLRGRAIHIRDGRIVNVAGTATRQTPDKPRQVDGRGAFVVPGFFDMHVHLGTAGVVNTASLTDQVQHGVLGVRDMGFPIDSLSVLDRLVRAHRDESVAAPRIWFVGPTLNGPSRMSFPQHVQVADSEAIDSIVERIAIGGGMAVKVHDLLSRDAYRQVAMAARAQGLTIVGHIPALVTVDDVLREHQRSIDHLGGLTHGVLMGCSRDTKARQRVAAAIVREDFFRLYRVSMSAAHLTPLLDGFDANLCTALARRFRAAGSWHVPNLVLWKTWATKGADFPESPSNEDVIARHRLYRTMLEITRILHREQVPLMVGTDGIGSIHDELAALVEAGLTPIDALRAATVQPARFLRSTASLGALKTGYTADFVLLDGNPLEDIRNSRRIIGVVQGGRFYDVGVASPARE